MCLKGKILRAKLSAGSAIDILIKWIAASTEGKELLEMMCKVYGMRRVKGNATLLRQPNQEISPLRPRIKGPPLPST